MTELAWWQRGAIYQIYPRSFADSDGDGVGDLPGVLSRLDHLVDARRRGAVAVAVLPLADGGLRLRRQRLRGRRPVFGTLADFDALVEAAHARGLRVIVDWVPNHTSDRHPWFSDPGPAPLVRLARPAQRLAHAVSPQRPGVDARRGAGQWYLHSFLPQQPDLELGRARGRGRDARRAALLAAPRRRRLPDGRRLPDRQGPAARRERARAAATTRTGRRSQPRLQGIRARARGVRRRPRWRSASSTCPTQADLVRYVNSGDQLHMVHNFHFLELPWSAARVPRDDRGVHSACSRRARGRRGA